MSCGRGERYYVSNTEGALPSGFRVEGCFDIATTEVSRWGISSLPHTICWSRCFSRQLQVAGLHSVFALDPAGNVGSPGKRSSKSLNNVVPLDPRSILNRTGFPEQQSGLNARVDADSKEGHGGDGKKSRRHLGHDGSKNLGGGVLSLPGHVLSHEEVGGRLGGGDLRSERKLVDAGGGVRDGGKSRRDGHNGGEEDETEFCHFRIFC